jgi:hypothetical protein
MGSASLFSGLRRLASFELPADISPDSRRVIAELRRTQINDCESIRERLQILTGERDRAQANIIQANVLFNQALLEVEKGASPDLGTLRLRCEEARLAKDKLTNEYRAITTQFQTVQVRHDQQLQMLMQTIMIEHHRRSSGLDAPEAVQPLSQSTAPHAGHAPIIDGVSTDSSASASP